LLKVHKDLIETVAMLRQQGFDVHLQIGGEDEKGGTGYRRER
jgi:colanic acid/amylovoran biosynthesis glycosyltransferase